jgi:osmoprotectant transport system substrate-binding protein
MKRFKNLALIICIVMSTIISGGCSKKDENVIKIGSKDFTESFILAELYATALEANGYKVERKFNLGGTNVAHAAMLKGDLDIYPEYTGTCLLNVLKQDMKTDPEEVYNLVKEEYSERFGIVVLDPAKANNTQALAISKAASEKYGIKTISDLQANASEIRFASSGAFEENPDGMPALLKTYGVFNFKKVDFFDNAIKYELIKKDIVDLVVAFGTDGQLVDPSFVVLEDDKSAWPPYNIVPVVREETLLKMPEIEDILNELSALLDNETMRALNAEVDVNMREPADVAKEFYKARFSK